MAMKSIRNYVVCLFIAMSGLAGCGTTSGALLGGAAGYAIGGDTKSTVGGAVVGGILGHEMSR